MRIRHASIPPWLPVSCRMLGCAKGSPRLHRRAQHQVRAQAGSALTKRPPRWIMVADLVETSQLYGRTAARIEPEALEEVGAHLLNRTYSEPHWDSKRRVPRWPTNA